jgi:hypothetical protein
MKIFVTHASNFDYINKLYKPLRESVLDKKYEFIFPHEEGSEKLTKDIIKSCKIVIAECSLPSTGQGIELGWANIYNVPIFCLYERGNKISGALHFVSDTYIEYSNEEDIIKKIQDILEHI